MGDMIISKAGKVGRLMRTYGSALEIRLDTGMEYHLTPDRVYAVLSRDQFDSDADMKASAHVLNKLRTDEV